MMLMMSMDADDDWAPAMTKVMMVVVVVVISDDPD